MNIVIVGAGDVGFSVAKSLSADGHDITLVDSDPERGVKAANELDVMFVNGNGARPNVLAKAGVADGCDVDLLIACTNRDEVNIMACWSAKRAGVKRLISRAVGSEFADSELWSSGFGIDKVISPERTVSRELVGLLESKGAVVSSEIDDKAGVFAFRVEDGSPVSGKDLMHIRAERPELITIIVYIQRGDAGFIPKAADTLEPGDIAYSFCYIAQIGEIAQMYQKQKRRKLRSVMIIGAGKVGLQTARLLLKRRPGIQIKIIDRDKKKCDQLVDEMPQAMILWGDGGDPDLLESENIASCDGFVASTDDDERNIVYASLAKALGARKSIPVIRRRSYSRLISHLPIDAIVNRNDTLSSVIISSVRNPIHANTLMIFESIGAEAIEVIIPEDSPAVGVALKDLSLPTGALVGLARRSGTNELFIPTGMSSFNAGDKAIIFSARDSVEEVLDTLGAKKD